MDTKNGYEEWLQRRAVKKAKGLQNGCKEWLSGIHVISSYFLKLKNQARKSCKVLQTTQISRGPRKVFFGFAFFPTEGYPSVGPAASAPLSYSSLPIPTIGQSCLFHEKWRVHGACHLLVQDKPVLRKWVGCDHIPWAKMKPRWSPLSDARSMILACDSLNLLVILLWSSLNHTSFVCLFSFVIWAIEPRHLLLGSSAAGIIIITDEGSIIMIIKYAEYEPLEDAIS